MVWNDDNLIKVLKEGGVVVMPTDTLYGIVGNAFNENTVNRIYDIRKRDENKPCIILISDIADLRKFSIDLSIKQRVMLEGYWPTFVETKEDKPSPVSVVLDCPDEKFYYLHRGMNTLAFRVPIDENLRLLLSLTGPIIAPSANIEGFSPSHNADEAKKYFDDKVDLYIDGGEISGSPSRVIKLYVDGTISILR